MKISERLSRSSKIPLFSFEFFPPKTDQGAENLQKTLTDLAVYNPGYVSVTYGAGGSTQARTLDLVRRIQDETQIPAMAHLTCVGATADDIDHVLDRLVESGIQNILALRGDPPAGEKNFVPPKAFPTRRIWSASSVKSAAVICAWLPPATRKVTSRRRPWQTSSVT